ncbi:putative MLP-like protein 34-like isoform 1 [Capsicum annuum]|nr:putative MLP-like protein 34-like isoform 1 [Capsicum annuum]KAF3677264.1 putative MLP-like protein 34-like isoform 1 [Capsicum annuum]
MRLSSGYSDCVRSSLTFIHGAFHWLIYKSPCYTIMSFNISNEVYREIPLLDWMYRMWMFKIDHGVQVLRGMLYYYSTHNIEGCPSTFKLWTMKDYGVKESWIQWLTIREMGVGSAIPHCVFADGEIFDPEMYSAKLSGYLFHVSIMESQFLHVCLSKKGIVVVDTIRGIARQINAPKLKGVDAILVVLHRKYRSTKKSGHHSLQSVEDIQ